MSREQFLSNDEIAKTLGLSKRTVEKHISLALATIIKNLGDFLYWLFIFFIKLIAVISYRHFLAIKDLY